MNAPIQIRKPAVAEGLRLAAKAEGKSITDLVEELLAAHQAKRDDERERRLAAIRRIQAEVRQLPRIGPDLTDDDLYDEDGLPR